MANLKNIVDLPVAESAEGLNLIVNDNGSAKQIAASEVGVKSWNDLKDKPFGAEAKKIAIFENQNTVGDDYSVIEIDPLHLTKLKVGDFIEIVYNGVSYLTVLKAPFEDGSSAAYEIGNLALIGYSEDYNTGEPFYAAITLEAIFPIFCAENAIVSAYFNDETVHKLDAKYLPNVGCGYDLVVYGGEDCRIVNGSFAAVRDKMLRGEVPFVYLLTTCYMESGIIRFEPDNRFTGVSYYTDEDIIRVSIGEDCYEVHADGTVELYQN